uniref:MKRN2 opposite strand protein-like C-terminal domain-containing protein n=1 Tax=Ditylenchus dipsaci TaxID=166011 RepID=A0A915EUW9_9BILA
MQAKCNRNQEILQTKLRVLLQPSNGEFSSYEIGKSDLHVGIYDGESTVFSFCDSGMAKETIRKWEKALHILSLHNVSVHTLHDFMRRSYHAFNKKTYAPHTWNCFDFVIEFLRSTTPYHHLPVHSKTAFVREIISEADFLMDNLEQENVQDADRQMDRHDFQRQQFEIFKHNFREAIDEHDNGEAIHSLVLSSELRKDVVNMTRKLQKAQLNLQALKDPSPIQSVISKITEVNDQLLQLTKSSTEYSPQNVELPEFDQDDIELLFGHSTQQTNNWSHSTKVR